MASDKPQNVFFADLHHPGGRDEAIQTLFRQIPENTRRIFFLGDTFHYWINESSFIEDLYTQFFAQLRAWANQGIDLFFLEGNRDFLASHYLEEQPWIDVLPNPSIIDMAGRAVYIGHGDELAWNDWQYQLYKSFIRSTPMRFLANRLPDAMRRRTVRKMAEASKTLIAGKTSSTLQIPEKAYRQVIDTGVDLLLHGHVHQSYTREINTGVHAATIIAFGWSDGKRNFLHFDE
jgi:UDP-2,3-diacylglucosamine hydrolase